MEYILKEKGKKERYEREVTALLKAFSLAVPNDRAMKIKEEVGLFQAIKSAITKTTETGKENQEKFDIALKQILSKAVISDRVIDIFEAAGIQKPELSILSEGFLAEVKEMPSFLSPEKIAERRDKDPIQEEYCPRQVFHGHVGQNHQKVHQQEL
jgi:type I restriction enzyme R subunit